jgi:UPF0755 protein
MLKRGLTTAALAVLAGLVVLLWAWRLWTGPGPLPGGIADDGFLPATALVRVTPGMTLTAAADTLAARGILSRPRVLLVGAKLTGRDRSLRAGLYEITYGTSPRDLWEILTSGIVVQVRVTIPEGLDVGEIARIAGETLGFVPEDFLAAADSLVELEAQEGSLLGDRDHAVAFLDSLLAEESIRHPRQFRWCEGHLAPDTYLFAEGTDAVTAARFLVSTQRARLDEVMARPRASQVAGLSRQEILTLASIVEAEARKPEERGRIAAVYVNRLGKGRRLEADPTVAFILLKKGKRLFYKDLEVESPYNTYRNRGLPPGPIGSPGLAALEAAVRPDTTCKAMFFVSDGRGGHVFSTTAREHEEAVREFRRIRAQGNDGRND